MGNVKKACEVCKNQMDSDDKKILELRNHLLNSLKKLAPNIIVNGELERRLSGNLNITIPNIGNKEYEGKICPTV